MTENSLNSLNLLLDYSSCSDSDSEPLENADTGTQIMPHRNKPHQVKQKLPVPMDLLNSFKSPKPTDNPADHGGRIRSFPHERNSWATLVYVPFKNNLTLLHSALQEELIALGINMEIIHEPHLSLSKTLVIPHHWIEPLVDTLNKNLSQLKRFNLKFSSVEIFCNEEKTRTFIALGANTCKSSLLNFVSAVDTSAVEFNLPKYYKEPNFHASIAWCLQDCTGLLSSAQNKLNAIFNQFKVDTGDDCIVNVNHINMKSGNKFFSFPLT